MKRRGVVRIRQEVQVELPWHRFEALWQRDPEGPDEKGAGWNDVEEAIRWARRRAPIVHVRFGWGLTEWYAAGEKDGWKGFPRWPGSRRRRAAGIDPR
jgi:hypothetical protein